MRLYVTTPKYSIGWKGMRMLNIHYLRRIEVTITQKSEKSAHSRL